MDHHHHHATAADDPTVQILFLVLVVLAMGIHLAAARAEVLPTSHLPVGGHILMGVAMVCMLLPDGWDPVPWAGWAVVFSVSGAASLAVATRSWRSRDRDSLLHHADLGVGAAAMVVMVVDDVAWQVPALVTVVLVAILLVEALVAGAVAVRHMAAVAVPAPLLVSERFGQPGLSRARPVSPAWSMLARGLMATAMLYMLAGH